MHSHVSQCAAPFCASGGIETLARADSTLRPTYGHEGRGRVRCDETDTGTRKAGRAQRPATAFPIPEQITNMPTANAIAALDSGIGAAPLTPLTFTTMSL